MYFQLPCFLKTLAMAHNYFRSCDWGQFQIPIEFRAHVPLGFCLHTQHNVQFISTNLAKEHSVMHFNLLSNKHYFDVCVISRILSPVHAVTSPDAWFTHCFVGATMGKLPLVLYILTCETCRNCCSSTILCCRIYYVCYSGTLQVTSSPCFTFWLCFGAV